MSLEDFLRLMRGLLEPTNFKGKTYLVGGVVRDHLRGMVDFYDFDLTVQMRHGGLKLGSFLQHRMAPLCYETFPRFGTARMELEGIKLDFAETRSERYIPGRRYPRIRYCSIEEDFFRRDFSVNALYMELFSGKILDPSGSGKRDLQAAIIRTIRDADTVISEDYLRILRAIRFSASLGFCLHEDLRAALTKYAPHIGRLSHRAISRELEKMKAGSGWAQARQMLRELGILGAET